MTCGQARERRISDDPCRNVDRSVRGNWWLDSGRDATQYVLGDKRNLSALRLYKTTALELNCVGSEALAKDMCDVRQFMGQYDDSKRQGQSFARAVMDDVRLVPARTGCR